MINSLQLKKFRREHNLFVVEGEKSIIEVLHSHYSIHSLFLLESAGLDSKFGHMLNIISKAELDKISLFENNNFGVALVHIPKTDFQLPEKGDFSLVLDNIQDPGNMGTIIRTAAWFGFDKIYCSLTTVDVYNHKVLQSTMGNFTKVHLQYCDLVNDLFANLNLDDFDTFGAFLEGENYKHLSPKQGLLVFGNEGKGISQEVEKYITKKIKIPAVNESVESLNVAVAAGILMNHFKGI